jgi:tetratricopeptide (TPR) repeat protein
MLAYQVLNNYEGTVTAGKKALKFLPANLIVLTTLANVLPEGVRPGRRQDHKLDEAECYARKALQEVQEQKIPRSTPLEEWKNLKLRLEVSAHVALGLVALWRGLANDAVRELEWAVQNNPAPDGPLFLRLGSAYLMVTNYCAAAKSFDRALALGPEPVQKRAKAAILEIRQKKGMPCS